MKLRAIAVALAMLTTLAAGADARAAPALWVAKTPTATIYLFGTFQILEPDAKWRTPALDAAYAKSTTVWFETDIAAAADPSLSRDLILRYGLDVQHPLSTKLDAR